jgi:hypothetical protein
MRGSTLGCIIMLTLRMLMASLVAEAQQPTTVHRIGWLSTDFPPPASTSQAREEAFRQGLRALGYVEGQNLVLSSAMRRGAPSGSPTWQPSSSGSRWRCWWLGALPQSAPRSMPRVRSRS